VYKFVPVRNILKDVENNCPDCCEPEKTIAFLHKRGDFSYTAEWYREVWYFYNDALKLFPKGKLQKKQARQHTCEMMEISEETFKRIRKRFKGLIR